jgi:hypothetical protein
MSVTEVLKDFSTRQKNMVSREPHGAYDGDFWRQSSRSERLNFVQGYIACEHIYLPHHFSRLPEYYVNAISAWYGVSDEDESVLNDKTANNKIGNVLLQLQDKTK